MRTAKCLPYRVSNDAQPPMFIDSSEVLQYVTALCEAVGITSYVPVMHTVNNQGDGALFGSTDFCYERESDTYICPGNRRLLNDLRIHVLDSIAWKRH